MLKHLGQVELVLGYFLRGTSSQRICFPLTSGQTFLTQFGGATNTSDASFAISINVCVHLVSNMSA